MQILPPFQGPSQQETTRKDEGCQSCFFRTIIIRNTTARRLGIKQFSGKRQFSTDLMSRAAQLLHNSRQWYYQFLTWSAIIAPNPFFCASHQAGGLGLAFLPVQGVLRTWRSGSCTLILMMVITVQWILMLRVRLRFALVDGLLITSLLKCFILQKTLRSLG
jgi:hypothetical protein